jgi:hypothetical protein
MGPTALNAFKMNFFELYRFLESTGTSVYKTTVKGEPVFWTDSKVAEQFARHVGHGFEAITPPQEVSIEGTLNIDRKPHEWIFELNGQLYADVNDIEGGGKNWLHWKKYPVYRTMDQYWKYRYR